MNWPWRTINEQRKKKEYFFFLILYFFIIVIIFFFSLFFFDFTFIGVIAWVFPSVKSKSFNVCSIRPKGNKKRQIYIRFQFFSFHHRHHHSIVLCTIFSRSEEDFHSCFLFLSQMTVSFIISSLLVWISKTKTKKTTFFNSFFISASTSPHFIFWQLPMNFFPPLPSWEFDFFFIFFERKYNSFQLDYRFGLSSSGFVFSTGITCHYRCTGGPIKNLRYSEFVFH